MKSKAVIILVILAPIVYGQQNRKVARTESHYCEYALKLCRIQYFADRMNIETAGWGEGDRDMPMRRWDSLFNALISDEGLECWRDSSKLFGESVYIFRCQHILTLPANQYVLALTTTGRVYSLHGFQRIDFEKMVKEQYGNITDSVKAYRILSFYLETVDYAKYGRVIVGSNVSFSVAGCAGPLDVPKYSKDGNMHRFDIVTVDYGEDVSPRNGIVLRRTFSIGEDGSFIEERKEICKF